jgi:hypothetical protein
LRHLVACIQSGEKPLITPEHAFHVTEVMVRAMQAARDGQTRPVESTFNPLNFPRTIESKPAHFIHDRSH